MASRSGEWYQRRICCQHWDHWSRDSRWAGVASTGREDSRAPRPSEGEKPGRNFKYGLAGRGPGGLNREFGVVESRLDILDWYPFNETLTKLTTLGYAGTNIMKLTDEQVKQMRAEFGQGASAAELGTKYGVSRQTAYNVLAGKNRKYLGLGDGFGPQGEVEERLINSQGETLRVIRGLLGLTQVQFALQMGKSPSTIGNWETGITVMTIKDRRKLVGWVREKGLEADLIGEGQAVLQGGPNV